MEQIEEMTVLMYDIVIVAGMVEGEFGGAYIYKELRKPALFKIIMKNISM